MRLENRTPDAPKRGRTKPCTEVADRAFPDVKFTDRNSVMVVVPGQTVTAFVVCSIGVTRKLVLRSDRLRSIVALAKCRKAKV